MAAPNNPNNPNTPNGPKPPNNSGDLYSQIENLRNDIMKRVRTSGDNDGSLTELIKLMEKLIYINNEMKKVNQNSNDDIVDSMEDFAAQMQILINMDKVQLKEFRATNSIFNQLKNELKKKSGKTTYANISMNLNSKEFEKLSSFLSQDNLKNLEKSLGSIGKTMSKWKFGIAEDDIKELEGTLDGIGDKFNKNTRKKMDAVFGDPAKLEKTLKTYDKIVNKTKSIRDAMKVKASENLFLELHRKMPRTRSEMERFGKELENIKSKNSILLKQDERLSAVMNTMMNAKTPREYAKALLEVKKVSQDIKKEVDAIKFDKFKKGSKEMIEGFKRAADKQGMSDYGSGESDILMQTKRLMQKGAGRSEAYSTINKGKWQAGEIERLQGTTVTQEDMMQVLEQTQMKFNKGPALKWGKDNQKVLLEFQGITQSFTAENAALLKNLHRVLGEGTTDMVQTINDAMLSAQQSGVDDIPGKTQAIMDSISNLTSMEGFGDLKPEEQLKRIKELTSSMTNFYKGMNELGLDKISTEIAKTTEATSGYDMATKIVTSNNTSLIKALRDMNLTTEDLYNMSAEEYAKFDKGKLNQLYIENIAQMIEDLKRDGNDATAIANALQKEGIGGLNEEATAALLKQLNTTEGKKKGLRNLVKEAFPTLTSDQLKAQSDATRNKMQPLITARIGSYFKQIFATMNDAIEVATGGFRVSLEHGTVLGDVLRDVTGDMLKDLGPSIYSKASKFITPKLFAPLNAILDGSFSKAFTKFSPRLGGMIAGVENFFAEVFTNPSLLSGISQGMTGLAASMSVGFTSLFPAWGPVILSGLSGVTTAVTAFFTGPFMASILGVLTGPVGWAVIGAGIIYMFRDTFVSLSKNIGKWMGQAFRGVLNFIGGLFTGESEVLIWNGVKSLVGGAVDIIFGAFEAIGTTILSFFTGLWDGVFGTNLSDSLSNASANISAMFSSILSPIETLKNWYDWFMGNPVTPVVPNAPTVPQAAEGAIAKSKPGGSLVIVGEGGQDEYIIPDKKVKGAVEQVVSNLNLTSPSGNTDNGNLTAVEKKRKRSEGRLFAEEQYKVMKDAKALPKDIKFEKTSDSVERGLFKDKEEQNKYIELARQAKREQIRVTGSAIPPEYMTDMEKKHGNTYNKVTEDLYNQKTPLLNVVDLIQREGKDRNEIFMKAVEAIGKDENYIRHMNLEDYKKIQEPLAERYMLEVQKFVKDSHKAGLDNNAILEAMQKQGINLDKKTIEKLVMNKFTDPDAEKAREERLKISMGEARKAREEFLKANPQERGKGTPPNFSNNNFQSLYGPEWGSGGQRTVGGIKSDVSTPSFQGGGINIPMGGGSVVPSIPASYQENYPRGTASPVVSEEGIEYPEETAMPSLSTKRRSSTSSGESNVQEGTMTSSAAVQAVKNTNVDYKTWEATVNKYLSQTDELMKKVGGKNEAENERVRNILPYAMAGQELYGIPASLTISKTMLEGGARKAGPLEAKDNNPGGMKASKGWKGQVAYYDARLADNEQGVYGKIGYRKYDSKTEGYYDLFNSFLGAPKYQRAINKARDEKGGITSDMAQKAVLSEGYAGNVESQKEAYMRNTASIKTRNNLYALDELGKGAIHETSPYPRQTETLASSTNQPIKTTQVIGKGNLSNIQIEDATERVLKGGNYSNRKGKIDKIVLHSTGSDKYNKSSVLNTFSNKGAGVSAHYFIGKDGEIVQMLPNEKKGWHANSANDSSIGIEVQGATGLKQYNPKQVEAVAKLTAHLREQYGDLPLDTHSTYSPRERTDDPFIPKFRDKALSEIELATQSYVDSCNKVAEKNMMVADSSKNMATSMDSAIQPVNDFSTNIPTLTSPLSSYVSPTPMVSSPVSSPSPIVSAVPSMIPVSAPPTIINTPSPMSSGLDPQMDEQTGVLHMIKEGIGVVADYLKSNNMITPSRTNANTMNTAPAQSSSSVNTANLIEKKG